MYFRVEFEQDQAGLTSSCLHATEHQCCCTDFTVCKDSDICSGSTQEHSTTLLLFNCGVEH